MKPKPANLLTQTLLKLETLTISFGTSCSQATDEKFGYARLRINTRWKHLDLVLRRVGEHIELIRKARQGLAGQLTPELSVLLTAAPSLDIETFYIVVRSLMDDVAILTPYFYPKGKMRPRRYSFNDQLKWYKSHPDFDPPMTQYLKTQLGWFDELKESRDDLIHRQCDVLPITVLWGEAVPEGFAIIHKHEDEKIDYQPLEKKFHIILKSLLAFLNFYASHFKERIPNDWPNYKDIGGREPKGSVDGLEFLKRWSE